MRIAEDQREGQKARPEVLTGLLPPFTRFCESNPNRSATVLTDLSARRDLSHFRRAAHCVARSRWRVVSGPEVVALPQSNGRGRDFVHAGPAALGRHQGGNRGLGGKRPGARLGFQVAIRGGDHLRPSTPRGVSSPTRSEFPLLQALCATVCFAAPAESRHVPGGGAVGPEGLAHLFSVSGFGGLAGHFARSSFQVFASSARFVASANVISRSRASRRLTRSRRRILSARRVIPS